MFFIRVTKRSSYLQDNTFISQLFQDPNICPGLGDRTRELPKGLFTHEPGFQKLHISTCSETALLCFFFEPQKGLATYKTIPSFRSYFKTPIFAQVLEIEPVSSLRAFSHMSLVSEISRSPPLNPV